MEKFTSDLQILSASRALKIEALDAWCHYQGSCDGCPFDDEFDEEGDGCNAPVFWDDTPIEEIDAILKEWIDEGFMLPNGQIADFAEENPEIYEDINRVLGDDEDE